MIFEPAALFDFVGDALATTRGYVLHVFSFDVIDILSIEGKYSSIVAHFVELLKQNKYILMSPRELHETFEKKRNKRVICFVRIVTEFPRK